MSRAYPIDFVRQLIEQTMLEEHIKEPTKYYGGANQVSMFSFYEQLQKEEEVNRYVEIYRDLSNQQNRTGLIMNGTIVAPENPTITNINSSTIIPMSFTCSFRVKMKNRDTTLDTINHLIELLKGRAFDIIETNEGKLFKVGTLGNNVNGSPLIKSGDYLGQFTTIQSITTKLNNLVNNYGFVYDGDSLTHYYYIDSRIGLATNHGLKVIKKIGLSWDFIEDDGTQKDIIFPPKSSAIAFNKWKLSISFESIRCDEPRTLNSEEYCVISFGGSATLTSDSVMLGNNLTKLGIKKSLIKASEDIVINDTFHWLEPLEMPSGNSADTQVNQLISNKFIQNTHTDSLTINLQYSFILDKNVDLLKQWFMYARYGIQTNGSTIPYLNGITPNMIYTIREMWSSFGEVEVIDYNAKIVESIDIENTESDALTIVIPFQLQGENY